jgi:hypothetical protein
VATAGVTDVEDAGNFLEIGSALMRRSRRVAGDDADAIDAADIGGELFVSPPAR